MCFPYDQCQFCGTYCENNEANGCMCCDCAFFGDYDLYCDWCLPDWDNLISMGWQPEEIDDLYRRRMIARKKEDQDK